MNISIQKYKKLINLQEATFLRIEHEDAMVSVVYRVILSDGLSLILKICPRIEDYVREVYFLKRFAGLLPVPRIIQEILPDKDIHGAILMECLPGNLLKREDLTEPMAYEIGSLLAHIHATRLQAYGDITQSHSLSNDPRAHFMSKFNESFSECRNHLPVALLEHALQFYDKNIDLLTSVDGPCVIHRDFRPGNIMVFNGRLQGIIDWSSARASFAEEDFCPLEFNEWPTDSNSKKSFLAGYASVRPVPDYKRIMPLLRLNRALATIGFVVKRETWDNVHASLYQLNRQYLDKFFMLSD